METHGAIAQLLTRQRTVIVDSDDGYESTLQVTYSQDGIIMGYSSEGSIPYDFTSVISFLSLAASDVV